MAAVARCACRSTSPIPASVLALADARARRSDRRRARGAARARGRRPVSAGRPPDRRPLASAARRSSARRSFAKDFMARHGIPTARFDVCDTLESALDAVSGREFGFPVVVKADGLAGGQGRRRRRDRAEAEAAVRAAMVERQFGGAGATARDRGMPHRSRGVVLRPRATAPGRSRSAPRRITSGSVDDDQGPNTGGMGAFAPSPLATPQLMAIAC